MISYKVVHHVPGRIRLHVPVIKNLSIATLKQLATLPIPEGITDVSANPLTGSIVIKYEPARCDILKCLDEMMENAELLATIGVG
ncbi:MAG: hypothetical protein HQL08_03465 [Nitrospirae bacterium]|nr:hypothetical protein [Nitrospirota bacterium]